MLSGLMRSMSVVVSGVGAENTESVALAPELQVVEDLAPQCPDGPLTVCVHPRGLRGGLDGFDALVFEDGVEGFGVFAVPVADQEAQWLQTHALVEGEVSGLLGRPLCGRMRGYAGDVEAACAVLEEDQRVDPAKIHQIDVQEVAGDDGVGRSGMSGTRAMSARRGGEPGRHRLRSRSSRPREAPILWPSRASSPWILRQPQRGFSRASRSTNSFTAFAVAGRPGLLRHSP